MENASKALLIVATVLVVIILIAVGMKIYSSTTDAQKVGINSGKTINDKTREATDFAVGEITGNKIKFLSKETRTQKDKKDLVLGDIVKINSEEFVIFAIGNEGIKALPYYNIEIKLNNPVQSKNAGTTQFASERYWDSTMTEVPMVDDNGNPHPKNIVQKYINAYKETLKKYGVEGIQVRAATMNELSGNSVYNVTKEVRKNGMFWLSSCIIYHPSQSGTVWHTSLDQGFGGNWYDKNYGVRPIIIIPI